MVDKKISYKKVEQDIEKYISQLKIFLKKNSRKSKIKLGNPNDKHLRTYIKNWYNIKLLYPETIDFEIVLDRKKINKFISDYKKDKEKIIFKSVKKLNKTPKFIIK